LSQVDLARAAEVSPDAIAQMENYETLPDENAVIYRRVFLVFMLLR
jgi:hypothetical protein